MRSPHKGRMCVLLVSHTLDRGGLEEAVLATAEGLDKRRFDVHVAFFVAGDAAARLGRIPGVHAVHITTPHRAGRLLALRTLTKQIGADILHNHFCWYGLPSAMLSGARRLETVHNVYSWFTPAQRAAYSLNCLLAERLIAVSSAVHAYAVQRFPPAAHKRWDIVHNGIDPQRYRRTEVRALRSSLGLDPGNVVAGFSGRLEEEKGVSRLLDVGEMLLEMRPEVRILIAGGGSLDRGLRESAAMRRLANVVFAGYRTDMAQFYSVFDMVILPSLYEGLPLALLEAMAAGCPAVAFRVGGIPEAVDEGIQGYLVEPGSVPELAERISRLAVDRERRMTMGKASVQRVTERFSASAMIGRIQDIYEDLAGGSRA